MLHHYVDSVFNDRVLLCGANDLFYHKHTHGYLLKPSPSFCSHLVNVALWDALEINMKTKDKLCRHVPYSLVFANFFEILIRST